MPAIRPFSLFIAVIVAIGSFIAPDSRADCTQLSGVSPSVGNGNESDLAELNQWAVLFNCAANGTSAQAQSAASLFEQKVKSRMTTVTARGIAGFQGFLGGGSASFAFGTGIALRNRGLSTPTIEQYLSHPPPLQNGSEPDTYTFNPDLIQCGFSGAQTVFQTNGTDVPQWKIGNTCFEDYVIASAAYAWRAAYRKVTGDSRADGDVSAAAGMIVNSISPEDSICVYDPATNTPDFDDVHYNGGRGPCKAASENPIALLQSHPEFLVPLNHTQENPNYGIGLVSSLAHAYAGFTAGGLAPAFSFSQATDLNTVLRALFIEGQNTSSADGQSFINNCYFPTDYPFKDPPPPELRRISDGDRALDADDMKGENRTRTINQAGNPPTCADRFGIAYRPAMYQVLPFYQKFFSGALPQIDPNDQKFDFNGGFPSGDFHLGEGDIGQTFSWARYLVYGLAGSEWWTAGLPPPLCVPEISAPASVNGGASASASAAVPATAGVSYHWTIQGGTITSAADQQSVTFTADASGLVTLTLTVAGACPDHNSRQVQIPIIGCDATISPAVLNVDGNGGYFSTTVIETRQDCGWTATSNDDWIVLWDKASGTGNSFVNLNVLPNGGPNRTGTVTIAGKTLTVNQHSPCTYTVTSCVSLDANGGDRALTLRTSTPDCPWVATAFEGWARLTGPTSGAGDAVIPYHVDPNLTTNPRNTTIVVQGKGVTILQDGTLIPSRPIITKQPVPNQTIIWGQNIFINVDYTGVGIRQDWYKNGLGWVSGGEFGQAVVRRDLPDYPPNQDGSLFLHVNLSNCSDGAQSDIAFFTIVPSSCEIPWITGPDNNVGGTSVLLVVGVQKSSGPLHYQWYEGFTGDRSKPIPNSDKDNIFVSPPGDPTNPNPLFGRGHYWVEVSDSCGPQLSRTATATRVGRIRRHAVAHSFNGDTKTDLVLHNAATGENMIWLMDGTTHTSTAALPTEPDTNWQVAGVGDLNGSENPSLVLHNGATGDNKVWNMIGTSVTGSTPIEKQPDLNQSIGAIADIDGDGNEDIIWHNDATGDNTLWLMNGAAHTATVAMEPVPDTNWKMQGTTDFNGDGNPDLVFRNYVTGDNVVWLMENNSRISSVGLAARSLHAAATAAIPGSPLPPEPDTNWRIGELNDLTGDGRADLTYRNYVTGEMKVQPLIGTFGGAAPVALETLPDTNWRLTGTNASAPPVVPPHTTPTSIAVTATPAMFGGTTTLTATLTSNGSALAGKSVGFTLDAVSAGSATTDANGVAAVTAAAAGYPAGSHIAGATFTGDATYSASTATTPLTISQATPHLTWPSPAPIAYGTALSAAQLDAAADVAGTFTYAPPAGTILPTGTSTLSVTFTPADAANYTSASATVSIVVTKAAPAIAWPAPAPIVYGTPLSSAQLNATANVAGSFTYSPAAGTVLNAGTQTLTAQFTPADTANFASASASVSLVVNKAAPSITWATPAPIVYGTPLSSAQLNATANVAGSLTYAPAAGTVLNAGTQTLTAQFTPADTANFAAASASVSLAVNKATPSISWATPAPIVYGTPLSSAQLNATANVPGAFAYSPAAGTVLNAGAQTLTAQFTPADAANFASASASVSLVVNKATPSITWATPAPIVYGTQLSSAQLDATADVAGSFTYSPAAGTVLDAGTHTLAAHFTPADTRNYTDADAASTLAVQRAAPHITWAAPAGIVYGTPLSAAQLNAAADVAGSFAYAPPAGTILNAGPGQTLSAHFTPGDTHNYTDADATLTIDVAKAQQTLTWTPPSPVVYGTALSATKLDARVDVAGPAPAGALVYSPPAGAVLDAGRHTLTVIAQETANYERAALSVPLDVARAPLALRADAKSKLYGAAVPALTGTLTGVVNGDNITPSYATAATQQSPAGTYAITAALVDPNGRLANYDVTIVPSTLTVVPAPLQIAANAATKQYSDPIPQLGATFTGFVLSETPAVLAGTLSITTTATPLSAPGAYPIAVGGLASPNYAIVYTGATLTVTPEDARVAITSPLLVSGTAVRLTATVRDISATADANGDADAGDIRKATLAFVDRATNAVLCTAAIALADPSDARTGIATCTFTASSASAAIGARVGGYYVRDAAGDDVTLSIVPPTADSVTGGGAAGGAAFNVNLQYDKNDVVKGAFTYAYASGGRQYEIAANAVASLAIRRTAGGGAAAIVGTATLRDVTNASSPVVVDDAAPLLVTLTDAGEPSSRDSIAVTLLKKDGGLWLATGFDGVRASEAPLTSGNIAVHYGK
jgi:hypothetical protein